MEHNTVSEREQMGDGGGHFAVKKGTAIGLPMSSVAVSTQPCIRTMDHDYPEIESSQTTKKR